jgi:hypothetical protein
MTLCLLEVLREEGMRRPTTMPFPKYPRFSEEENKRFNCRGWEFPKKKGLGISDVSFEREDTAQENIDSPCAGLPSVERKMETSQTHAPILTPNRKLLSQRK